MEDGGRGGGAVDEVEGRGGDECSAMWTAGRLRTLAESGALAGSLLVAQEEAMVGAKCSVAKYSQMKYTL